MSTKATTLNSKKSVGALVKDWMSLVGIAIHFSDHNRNRADIRVS